MAHQYRLEKKIWTHMDFPTMGWHDSPIYGMTFQSDNINLSNKLLFDLDYILQWIDPVPPELHFSFWIAPATLVFKEVIDLHLEINNEPPNIFNFEILDIHRHEELTYPNGVHFGNGRSNWPMVTYFLKPVDMNRFFVNHLH